MDIGWLDFCLRVKDVKTSREFYEGLGFHQVEGEDSEGWTVVVNGNSRIGLFSAGFMGNEPFSLNFRGGDVPAIAEALKAKGYALEKDLAIGAGGGASATILDPDGHMIFFDCAPNEIKKL